MWVTVSLIETALSSHEINDDEKVRSLEKLNLIKILGLLKCNP